MASLASRNIGVGGCVYVGLKDFFCLSNNCAHTELGAGMPVKDSYPAPRGQGMSSRQRLKWVESRRVEEDEYSKRWGWVEQF